MTKKEMNLLSRINWDYAYSDTELLQLIKDTGNTSNMRLCFFIKSLERLNWQDLVYLWGLEECTRLYTDKVRKGIFRVHKELREIYDGLFNLLRNKTISHSSRTDEELEKFKSRLEEYRTKG